MKDCFLLNVKFTLHAFDLGATIKELYANEKWKLCKRDLQEDFMVHVISIDASASQDLEYDVQEMIDSILQSYHSNGNVSVSITKPAVKHDTARKILNCAVIRVRNSAHYADPITSYLIRCVNYEPVRLDTTPRRKKVAHDC